jgi:hypothetical protein
MRHIRNGLRKSEIRADYGQKHAHDGGSRLVYGLELLDSDDDNESGEQIFLPPACQSTTRIAVLALLATPVALRGQPEDCQLNGFQACGDTIDPGAVLLLGINSLPRMQVRIPGILMTPGSQAISASIFDAAGINGTANVAVSPP